MAYEYGTPSRPLEATLAALREGLIHAYRAEHLPAHRRSPRRTRRLRRIRGWYRGVGSLLAQTDRVVHETLPRIERDTGYTFSAPDGLIRVLMDRSTARLFSGLLAGFPEDALPVPARDLALLGSASDDARVLALISEVTLEVKGLPAGTDLVSLCDRWDLSRIALTCRSDLTAREKETLVLAVLGLIYVGGGTGALRGAVPASGR